MIVGKKESIDQRKRQRNRNIGTKTGRDDMMSILGSLPPPGVTILDRRDQYDKGGFIFSSCRRVGSAVVKGKTVRARCHITMNKTPTSASSRLD